MVTIKEVQNIVKTYQPDKVHIGVIGSHSALALGMSAKAFGAKTLIVVEKGRDVLYTREHHHLYDHVILVDKFKDILNADVQAEMLEYNTVWVPHRSFTVYVGAEEIESNFRIPMYGNRHMLGSEDRNAKRSQYYFLDKLASGIPSILHCPNRLTGWF